MEMYEKKYKALVYILRKAFDRDKTIFENFNNKEQHQIAFIMDEYLLGIDKESFKKAYNEFQDILINLFNEMVDEKIGVK